MSAVLTDAAVESRSPQRPDEVVGAFVACSAAQMETAARTARTAQAEWWASGPGARATALSAAAEALAAASGELAELVIAEVGKPRAEAVGEVDRAVAILRYNAQLSLVPLGHHLPVAGPVGSLLLDTRRPRGVAGLITPWNFPLAIPLWKAAPALAAGNAVLLKPAPAATATATRLQELLAPHLPSGLLTVLPGGTATGAALLRSSDVLSFTGSTTVGRTVAAASVAAGIPVQAEMGGLNASVVLPDADVAHAAKTIASAAMGYAGQKCTATSRVIVVGDQPGFVEALTEAVRGLVVGDPAEERTAVGPVIGAAAREAVTEAVDAARAAGGRVLTGGETRDPGWFVSPVVIDGLPPQARLNREEVFGPILSVLHAEDEDSAVQLVNATRYGLVTGLFTRDLDRALTLVPRFDTGMAKVNGATSGADYHASFGGEKDSGYGPAEQGLPALDFYSRHHTVTYLPTPR
ncbi:aldehyde dehydrogenase family protein [Streptomyces sp. NBC_00988]|uniref:aldehyde dehydrogenase family protein n=1 Tax=Streptomyces sp. NBC_00988 TaxID=2903704 RepID=UPI00386C6978|nr:aldehyde dehydrogenase family protein [Streptomyces sp. NBC_00988]